MWLSNGGRRAGERGQPRRAPPCRARVRRSQAQALHGVSRQECSRSRGVRAAFGPSHGPAWGSTAMNMGASPWTAWIWCCCHSKRCRGSCLRTCSSRRRSTPRCHEARSLCAARALVVIDDVGAGADRRRSRVASGRLLAEALLQRGELGVDFGVHILDTSGGGSPGTGAAGGSCRGSNRKCAERSRRRELGDHFILRRCPIARRARRCAGFRGPLRGSFADVQDPGSCLRSSIGTRAPSQWRPSPHRGLR